MEQSLLVNLLRFAAPDATGRVSRQAGKARSLVRANRRELSIESHFGILIPEMTALYVADFEAGSCLQL